jgi:hypothetical protein
MHDVDRPTEAFSHLPPPVATALLALAQAVIVDVLPRLKSGDS